MKTCQEQSAVKSWDDAIRFAKAKIKELEDSIEGAEIAQKRGDPWPGEAATHN